MKDRKKILDRFKEYEDRLLANNLLDSAEVCLNKFTGKSTYFLDPRQQIIADNVLKSISDIEYYFDGGIVESERKICNISNKDYKQKVNANDIRIICFSWQYANKVLSHRDFLGSLIGNGIKREMIGDIIVEEKKAFMACKSDISKYILANVNRIGNVAVSADEEKERITRNDNAKTISSTIASLRLDCVISAGFGISRSKALSCIKSNKVKLNWEEVGNASQDLNEKDSISLRGKGRILLEEISGNTKKDRIKVTIKKFL